MLVIMQEPVQPLSILRARQIGMMHVVDEGWHAMDLNERRFATTR